jgi:hypothetical protein
MSADLSSRKERLLEKKKKLPSKGVPTQALADLAQPLSSGDGVLRAKRAGHRIGERSPLRARAAVLATALSLFSFTGLFASQIREAFPEVATIAVEEIQAGMRGYGMSVFKGTTPERFEVEVLGVLQNQKPSGSYVLARLSGQNLEHSGVVAGMSGSPVYFDGRLAGAVAFAWPFAKEPIAGITPIASMRAIGEVAAASAFASANLDGLSAAVDPAELAGGKVRADRLDQGLAEFARAVSNDGSSSLLWGASGFGASTRGVLARLLPASAMSLAALGGGESAAIESDLGPGASVAALFVDGDLRLAATGTVTDRIGDKLFAFGHSAVGVSEISLPLATSSVVTVMPSALSSFKLSNSGPAVGRFERDHTYGAVGRIGALARTVPLVVRVSGSQNRRFDLRLAEVPQFLPALAAIGCLGAWEVAAGTSGVRSVDLALKVDLAGPPERRPLALEQSFEGENAPAEAVGYVMAVLSYLVRNDLAPLAIRALEVDVRLATEPRGATLLFAQPSRTRVAPGEALELQIDARGWGGESLSWSERLVLPEDLPSGRYSLLVGDGASADAARMGLAPAPPVKIDQVIDFLRSLHSSSDLVVLGVLASAGLSTGGEVLPRLPGSMRSIWGAMGARSATLVRSAILQNVAYRHERPLAGLLRVELDVRRPLDRESSGAGPGGGK